MISLILMVFKRQERIRKDKKRVDNVVRLSWRRIPRHAVSFSACTVSVSRNSADESSSTSSLSCSFYRIHHHVGCWRLQDLENRLTVGVPKIRHSSCLPHCCHYGHVHPPRCRRHGHFLPQRSGVPNRFLHQIHLPDLKYHRLPWHRLYILSDHDIHRRGFKWIAVDTNFLSPFMSPNLLDSSVLPVAIIRLWFNMSLSSGSLEHKDEHKCVNWPSSISSLSRSNTIRTLLWCSAPANQDQRVVNSCPAFLNVANGEPHQ